MIKTNLTGVYFRETTTNNKPDKTYYITYKDANNKKVWQKIGKYSEGVREAYCNQKRNEIITKQRNGEEPPVIAQRKKRNILSIQTIFDEYFSLRKEGSSRNSDESNFKNYISPFFKDIDFSNITKEDIQKFTLLLRKTKSKKKDVHLSSKTINNILNFLKVLIKYAFKNDFIKNDTSKYITLNDIDNERERFLSKEEIQILYENSKNDDTLYLLFKLALKTGGRLETLLNIHKKDIDFTHNLLTLKDFKNNSTYKAAITADLKEILLKRVNGLALNDKLFNSNPSRRLLSILDNLFNKGIDKEDRKNKIVFHSLRHTFASHLAMNDTPIFTIQKMMNHKDIKMTLRYAKLSNVSQQIAADKLDF